MATDICPACCKLKPTSRPNRVWCSKRCRQLIHRMGGPLSAAIVFDNRASVWESAINSGYVKSGQRAQDRSATAAFLRERAAALRAINGAQVGK